MSGWLLGARVLVRHRTVLDLVRCGEWLRVVLCTQFSSHKSASPTVKVTFVDVIDQIVDSGEGGTITVA